MKTLFDAIKQAKDDMKHHFDTKVDPISDTLNEMKLSLSTLGEHVDELEHRVGSNEDNLNNLQTRVKELEKDNSYLITKIDDLENRSRTSNLRFIRVPEGAEGPNMLEFMNRHIPQILGQDNFPTPPVIESAHHTPTVRQTGRSGPRPILIKLLHLQDKLKILRLAREKKDLFLNGVRIFIFPDYSPDLTKRRRSFDPVKRRLRELHLSFSLRYPCKLHVFADGNEQIFTDHKAAEAVFMSSANSSMNSPG